MKRRKFIKRLELLKEAVPGISRVLVLAYLADPIAPLQLNALKKAAHSLGVTLQIQDIRAGDDLPAAFEAGAREHADGLLTTVANIFVVNRARVIELAARYRLPAIYHLSIQVADAGGLMAYEPKMADLYRLAHHLRRPYLEGCQAFRSSDRAADQVQAGHQS